MQKFTVACAQFAVTPMAVAENVERAVAWVERAARENDAQLVVLPETVTTGFTPDCPSEELWDRVDTLPGAMTTPVADVARKLGVYVVLPTYERGPQRGVVYNSAALFGPTGEMLGVYRKTHLFPTERLSGGGWSTPGGEPVVVETELATIGLTICYDGDFPELYRCEAIRGAEVIVRPAALLRSFEIWEMTNRARAYDNHVYIAACNAVGADAGGSYYFGHSMIVSPIAQVLALARGTEEIVAAELDPDPIKRVTYGARTPMIFDHLEDRNLAAYREILTPAQSRFTPAQRIPYTDPPSEPEEPE
jgi:predicted amidohydrolase